MKSQAERQLFIRAYQIGETSETSLKKYLLCTPKLPNQCLKMRKWSPLMKNILEDLFQILSSQECETTDAFAK